MSTESPADVIIGALRLARERVTGDDPDEKEQRREQLADLMVRVQMHDGGNGTGERPTTQELTKALGDPDDGKIRSALHSWG
jgi:hypothetical protein